ncbi:MAG TPA: hypothetical protein VE646_02780 [Actinomycetota bacterium]|jgi:hypothetical protein|nr:hypothetical protein [Actinomycetota bacterium]
MTGPIDWEDEMRVPWLDRDTADRLLDGHVDPDDAPPGYQEVAGLMRDVGAPASARELLHQDRAVSAASGIRSALGPVPVTPTPRRSTVRPKHFRAKLTGILVIGTLVGTTGLAAAGVLPDPAQNVVSDALSQVGITIPSIEHPASTGTDISQMATSTDATGVAKGAQISDAASGGMSQAGQHGATSQARPSEAPPVTTPNPGGTATANAASGGAAEVGTSIADQESQGRSAEGSGNAGRTGAAPTPASQPTPTSLPLPAAR